MTSLRSWPVTSAFQSSPDPRAECCPRHATLAVIETSFQSSPDPRRLLSKWCGSWRWGGVGAAGWLVGPVGLGRAARAFQRVKAPLLWVTPRLVRRTRLTAAALVVSQRWLAATPR